MDKQIKSKLTVVKVGGKILETPDMMTTFLDGFARIKGLKLLVHGGGRSATRIAERLGIETKMVDGRRITDASMLEVVTMVYGGLVNKNTVAALQARGVNAIGLTGADMNIIESDKRPAAAIDYGYVGDVRQVNAEALALLLDNGFTPVVAPLTHDGHGQMLNTNADTVAASVAQALSESYDVSLIYCFEKPGVLSDPDDDNSAIPELTAESYARLREEGVISGGMIPKLDNAFQSISAGVKEVVITRADAISAHAGTRIH